jgi:hypothetical protein
MMMMMMMLLLLLASSDKIPGGFKGDEVRSRTKVPPHLQSPKNSFLYFFSFFSFFKKTQTLFFLFFQENSNFVLNFLNIKLSAAEICFRLNSSDKILLSNIVQFWRE